MTALNVDDEARRRAGSRLGAGGVGDFAAGPTPLLPHFEEAQRPGITDREYLVRLITRLD